MSNLKQIGLGIMMYAQDYDSTLPANTFYYKTTKPFVGIGEQTQWQLSIYPYTKSVQLYWCPSSPHTDTNPTSGQYGANNRIMKSQEGATQAAITAPAQKYLVMDFPKYSASYIYAYHSYDHYYLPGAGQFGGDCSAVQSSENQNGECQNGRHFDGINIIFADGHVKWQRSDIVLTQALRQRDGKTSAWSLSKEAQ